MNETEAFLIRVVNSCQTQEQLSWARQWCLRVQDFHLSEAILEALIVVDKKIQSNKIEPWEYGARHPFNSRFSPPPEC